MNYKRAFIFILLCSFSSLVWGADSLSVTSSAFANNGKIPMNYTCNGTDVAPPLNWSEAPPNTVTFALIVVDADPSRGSFYHWILYNIPPTTTALPEDPALPAGTIAGSNTWNVTKYSGPCPPKGITHDYQFDVYALNVRLNLRPGATGDEVMKAIEGHVILKGTLTGLYAQP